MKPLTERLLQMTLVIVLGYILYQLAMMTVVHHVQLVGETARLQGSMSDVTKQLRDCQEKKK